jgi:hypothetical protein
VAGWATVADIPQRYKHAIQLIIAHWYENREAVVSSGAVPKQLELAVDALLMTDRVYASW